MSWEPKNSNSPNTPITPSLPTKISSWEAAYTREIHNNSSDTTDEGIIWFDESNAEDTVLSKLQTFASTNGGPLSPTSTRFLDLGTGNGHMLFALREDTEDDEESPLWTGEMIGVDYSPKSIELARQLDAQRREALDDETGPYANIRFEQWDLLTEAAGDWLGEGFEVVLDKGTFDAISLMPHSGDTPHPCETYRAQVEPLIKPGHFLVTTSCNWTKDELIGWLAPEGAGLTLHDEAKYRTFTFGGKTGQSVVTLIFQRKA